MGERMLDAIDVGSVRKYTPSSSVFCFSLAALTLLSFFFCSGALAGQEQAKQIKPAGQEKLFKLNASLNELLGGGSLDLPYRSFTRKGIMSYLNKDYSQAEDWMSKALQDGEGRGATKKEIAILQANLAGVYRDEHKYAQSGQLFAKALAFEACRENGAKLPLPYVLSQYAAYLKLTGSASEAKFAEMMAAKDFMPTVKNEKQVAQVEESEAEPQTQIAAYSAPLIPHPKLEPEPQGQAPAASPPAETAPAKTPKVITLRITTYSFANGAEIAFEALLTANDLLAKGHDVTLLLDREGVRLANKHNIDSYQVRRQSTEKLISTQSLLQKYMVAGGKVVASERWAKVWGLDLTEIPHGVVLLPDSQFNDFLLEKVGTIVDY